MERLYSLVKQIFISVTEIMEALIFLLWGAGGNDRGGIRGV
jgi:hypothetical protein